MSRGRFAFLFITCCLLVVAFKVALPFALASLCGSARSGCGVIALVGGMFGGLGMVVTFMVAMLVLFSGRLASARMSRWWLLAVFFFVYNANSFIYGIDNSWSANFSAGNIAISIPYTLISLLAFSVFLTIYEPPAQPAIPHGHRVAWKVAVWSAPIVIVSSSLTTFVMQAVAFSRDNRPEAAEAPLNLAYFSMLPIIAILVFSGALAYIAFVSNDSDGGTQKTVTAKAQTAARGFGRRIPR